MFELIQKRFQTVVLSFIVGLLCLVFVLQFQAPNARQGCSPQGGAVAARVGGTTLTEGDFRAAYALPDFPRFPTERARTLRLRENTMDGLIERELLAQEAERIGFSVDSREVMREVARTGVIRLTPPVDAPAGYPGPEIQLSFQDREGRFSSKNMRRVIRNHLGRTVDDFERWQAREKLAQMVRDNVLASVAISPAEVHDEYVRETDSATMEFVKFSPSYFRERVEASEANVRAWMAEHSSEVDAEYQRQRHRYTGLEEQRRASHILVKADSSAGEEARATARTKAEDLLRRAQAGADFAALAREHSEDTGSARQGGDLGWNARGRMVAPFDEAQFGTEPGQITDHVVESNFGFHVIKVVGRREGDVPEDEAKRELAEGLYRRSRASELAREQAERALAYWRDHDKDALDRQLAFDWNVPSSDAALPERDTFAPQVRESRPFGRSESPVSATNAATLTRAVFERNLTAPFAEAPIALGDDYYIFRLTARTEATEEGYTDEVRERIGAVLLAAKQGEALRAFVHQLRDTAASRGELEVNEEILSYRRVGEDGAPEGEEESEGERESSLLLPRQSSGA